MKKLQLVLLIALLTMGIVACSAATTDQTPEVVIFTDEVLEAKVRDAMKIPNGDITIVEAEAVTDLDLSIEPATSLPRIKDISSLKYFTNLTTLKLAWALDSSVGAVDISTLASLTKLIALYMNSNDIEDISPLSGLTNMRDLKLFGNQISDISALAGMTMMEDLWMQDNKITDISALSGMSSSLYRLYLDENQITDVTPLAQMRMLISLKLGGNPIEDYSSLADIYPKLEEKDFEMK
jgi:internalin A